MPPALGRVADPYRASPEHKLRLVNALQAEGELVSILVVLQVLFTYVPVMHTVFHTAAVDATSWAVIGVLGIAVFAAVEAKKAWMRRRNIYSL